MSKKVRLSDTQKVEIAEYVCEKLGIDLDQDENAWTMVEFINFDAIQDEVWL